MVSSAAPTVEAYLAALPDDRRTIVDTVRRKVNARLPKGFHEEMGFGMITWVVPLSRYPDTYNKQPLGVCALAAQKRYVSLYLMGTYAGEGGRAAFEAAYAKTGKKLDMGKSCLRFEALDEVAWPVVERSLETLDVEGLIALYEASRAKTKSGQRAAAKKAAHTSDGAATAPKKAATAPKKAATAPKKPAAAPKKNAAAPKKNAAATKKPAKTK